MKKLAFFISVLALLAFTKNDVGSTSVVITSNSKLFILGKTNVSNFDCVYDVQKLEKPIPVHFKRKKDKIVFEKTVLVLENKNFDCGGNAINADFHKLLKTETYPEIFIKLKEIAKESENSNNILSNLEIDIAGFKKTYIAPVVVDGLEPMSIKGKLNLNLRDFNLEPPKKALGLVVVKDVIEINFELKVQER
ncbi:hypothetical protein KO566_11350 [Flavobacteriaceae bacterium XHP0103]|uniref:YceI family protein n=1 Tax=Marixanthotalea marina TaxID=2844359 RepID=UPI00298A0754|nr:hypothetical protein [Marixanthotalea marina]MBU3822659.1 hypothetical protein [Marixanthotalea marina]